MQGYFSRDSKTCRYNTNFKKNSPLEKDKNQNANAKPTSSLSQHFLSPCGCRKRFSIHQFLLFLIENLRVSSDEKRYGGVLMMDLPKTLAQINLICS